jgi:site-specific DNA recombinase
VVTTCQEGLRNALLTRIQKTQIYHQNSGGIVMKKTNTAIIYLQSDSNEALNIEKQRKTINKYCKVKNIKIVKEFVDQGVSRSNYQRLAFQKMLNTIQSKHIGAITTADIAKIGRTYKVLYYIKFFSKHNICFITVNNVRNIL